MENQELNKFNKVVDEFCSELKRTAANHYIRGFRGWKDQENGHGLYKTLLKHIQEQNWTQAAFYLMFVNNLEYRVTEDSPRPPVDLDLIELYEVLSGYIPEGLLQECISQVKCVVDLGKKNLHKYRATSTLDSNPPTTFFICERCGDEQATHDTEEEKFVAAHGYSPHWDIPTECTHVEE